MATINKDFGDKFGQEFVLKDGELDKISYYPFYNYEYDETGVDIDRNDTILYLVAHLILVSRGDGAKHAKTSQSIGSVSASYLLTPKGSADFFQTSSYGQMFLMRKKGMSGGGGAVYVD